MGRLEDYYSIIEINRQAWDSNEPGVSFTRSVEDITEFELHHTGAAGPRSLSFGDKQQWLLDIERYHEQGKGWSDIFYHVFVFADGEIWEGRDLRRSSTSQAANAVTVHIPGNSPAITLAQHESLVLMARWATSNNPINVGGHSDRSSTACPGDSGRKELDAIRLELNMQTPSNDHTHSYMNLSEHSDAKAAKTNGIWDGSDPTGATSRSVAAVMTQRALDLAAGIEGPRGPRGSKGDKGSSGEVTPDMLRNAIRREMPLIVDQVLLELRDRMKS